VVNCDLCSEPLAVGRHRLTLAEARDCPLAACPYCGKRQPPKCWMAAGKGFYFCEPCDRGWRTGEAPDPAGTPALQDAIRHMHGVESTWIESVAVREVFQGEVAWAGWVQVFDLAGHPSAKRAYAWSHATTGTKRRFVAVLGVPGVDSPELAVKAAIVSEGRQRTGWKPS